MRSTSFMPDGPSADAAGGSVTASGLSQEEIPRVEDVLLGVLLGVILCCMVAALIMGNV